MQVDNLNHYHDLETLKLITLFFVGQGTS